MERGLSAALATGSNDKYIESSSIMREPACSVTSDQYQLIIPRTPTLTGLALRLSVAVSEQPLVFSLYNRFVLPRQVPQFFQILKSEAFPEEPRANGVPDVWSDLAYENAMRSLQANERVEAALKSLGHAGTTTCSTASNARPTILDYHHAYMQEWLTPSEVADRTIKFIESCNNKYQWLSAWSDDNIRQQAAAATARYAGGRPLSVFDGVPFVVKDSIDALPYETSFGTRFMGQRRPCTFDAPAVAALKSLGAILLGKAAMNEFGVMAHGFNTQGGTTRNPHNPNKMSGGSSAGAAAAVAAGVCPIAIGTDGGGSIRIPSGLCGVVGLKPTLGRLADDHAAHAGYTSIIVSGPIANSVADATLLYAVMANVNYPAAATANGIAHADAASVKGSNRGKAEAPVAAGTLAAACPRPLGLPAELLPLQQSNNVTQDWVLDGLKPLQGLIVGMDKRWASDCAPSVLEVVKATVTRLQELGAAAVDIALPELELIQVGHLVTFAKEMADEADKAGWLNDWNERYQLNMDTRLFYCNAATFTDEEYEQAQRMRTRGLVHFRRAFEQCDVIITPATPTTAADIPAGVHTTGVYDLKSTVETIRFSQAANFLGLPALVLPGGRERGMGMPVGVQFIGRPWAESTLLRAAAALEQQMFEDGMPRPVPSIVINPIQCEKGVHPMARALTQKLWAKKSSRKEYI
eukprot:GHRR01002382.1.p1 GENE.GHRR01002382.1~~GHRR01002382.1.p1  ORF type:complete len:694 (+),score=228.48 GHRR01002382.1:133-2214(+)